MISVLSGLLSVAGGTVQAAGLPVVFSEVGGVFTNEFRLKLQAKSDGEIVRYTLDGSEPREDSTRYAGPIAVTNSLQVRARAFGEAGSGSDVVSHAYILAEPDLWSFDSNLPLAVIGTFGTEVNLDDRTMAAMFVLEPGVDGRTRLLEMPSMSTRLWFNQRGRASTRYPKKSFTLKLLDEVGEFRNLPLLGMPKDADWILYAPYADKTLMRNVLAYELSNQIDRWAPRTRFVELFVLEHAGKLNREDYVGVYVLTERVKRDGNRIDITNLDAADNSIPELTGGYIFKKDHSSRNMAPAVVHGYPPFEPSGSSRTGFPTGPGAFPADPNGFLPPYRSRSSSSSSSRSVSSRASKSLMVTNIIGAPVRPKRASSSTRSVMIDEEGNETMVSDDDEVSVETSFKTTVLTNRFYFFDPEPDEITGVQRSWLMNHLEETERAIAGKEFTDEAKGYRAFIDADSFIDYHLLVEVTKNVDGFRFSTFYHKDRNGRIKMGPLWDWNLSFGNCHGKQGFMPDRWLWPQLDDREYTWFRRLFEDPEFAQRYVDRWTELRATVFSPSNILGRVDELVRYLDESQKRNYERWPVMGITVNPNWFVAETYGGEVDWMKDWITKRLAWIDAQFVAVPKGNIDAQGRVTLEANGAEVYFTRDGSDPRKPGGDPAEGAMKYAETFALDPSQHLVARARAGARWSGPFRLNRSP